jgi:hypothetical protein
MSTNLNTITEAYIVPGQPYAVDLIDPDTGLTLHGGLDEAELRASSPEYKNAVRVSLEAWQRQRGEEQRTPITWSEITEQEYDDALCVLPPLEYTRSGFMMGEPYDHEADTGRPRFSGYRTDGNSFERSSRPMTRDEFRSIADA